MVIKYYKDYSIQSKVVVTEAINLNFEFLNMLVG